MKHIAVITLLIYFSQFAWAQEFEKSESPYILGSDTSGMLMHLPVQKVSVEAHISGIIAEVSSTQVYTNTTDLPLSASYVFPGSTGSAVNAMKMTIGDKTIQAKIAKKEEAEQAFE